MVPIFEGGAHSVNEIADMLSKGYAFFKSGQASYTDLANLPFESRILMMSQTCAFCVLGISELFHMLGMTSLRKSFVHNFVSKNWLLWVSFVAGIGLQFAVVMIPGLNSFFKCFPLDWKHWLIVFALSAAPVVVHEIVALVLFIRRKVKAKKA